MRVRIGLTLVAVIGLAMSGTVVAETTTWTVLDGFGGVHNAGSAALPSPASAYFGFDIARDLEFATVGFYVLDGLGAIHAGGGAAAVSSAPYFGFDVAKDLELGSGGMVVLDGFGGVHAAGGASPMTPMSTYFGWDIAADLELASTGFYVLDGFGGVHGGGGAPPLSPLTPYFGFDIARDLELAGTGFYVLDGYGGVHAGGGASPLSPLTPYFGFDIARDLELASTIHYVLDGYGGVHAGGGAPAMSPATPYFGFDIARDLELRSSGTSGGTFDPRTYDWAANTGYSATLTKHQGAFSARTDGMVIENLEITGGLNIYANNVTVKNSWIYNTNTAGTNNNASYYTVRVISGSLTIENSTIGHSSYTGERGLAGPNVTARNVEITHHFDGVKIGSNSTYEYMYVHDLSSTSPNPHADAFQNDGGGQNWTITRSYMSSIIANDSPQKAGDAGNAAALIKADLGVITNWEISESLFSGGNYQIYVVSDNNNFFGCPSNGALINNYFTDNSVYGHLSTTNATAGTDCRSTATIAGNVWEDTGEPIPY